MNKSKRDAITAAGFQIGDAAEFLGLTEEERAFVELRVAKARDRIDIQDGHSCPSDFGIENRTGKSAHPPNEVV